MAKASQSASKLRIYVCRCPIPTIQLRLEATATPMEKPNDNM